MSLLRWIPLLLLLSAGCARIENGFRYEYTGHVYHPDGKSGVKGVSLRLARVDAPEAPDLSGTKIERDSGKYVDKAERTKTNGEGSYGGALETVKGWGYSLAMGGTIGETQAPLPPMLPEVILYVQEPGAKTWMGYRIAVPPENQTQAYPRVRKIRLPDLIYGGKGEPFYLTGPTTQPLKPTPAP